MLSRTLFLCLIAAALPLGLVEPIRGSDHQMRLLPPEYEAKANSLRAAPAQQYDFSKAMLSDVLRFLATDSGISFFSLPDDSPAGSAIVTFSINASPFKVLETLCQANGLAIIPDNDIWYIRPADDRELIGKPYELKHNALERVEKVTGAGSFGGGLRGGGGGGGGNAGAGGGGGGGMAQGGAAAGLDLQGVQDSFNVKASEVINDIREILDLPREDENGRPMQGMMQGMGGAMQANNPEAIALAANSNELSAFRKPKVIWKSDSNTLYVVATRLQHLWVEGYLAAADKIQPMIAIEVKFVETARDPSREFGVDWSGTFGNGNTRRFKSADENGLIEYEDRPSTGFGPELAGLPQPFDFNDIGRSLMYPQYGFMSSQDINVKLRAMMRDENTTTTSYPRMVTLNNREVQIRSVVNTPVLSATSSATLGAGATTAQQIEYLPIGTVLNILPKKMEQDKVHLNMAITVSTIIGNEVIAGNPYPIASSRVYSAPVEVNSGYTVAVGGLDEARERDGESGVPFLSRIPILGYAFKTKSRSRNQKNLMLFITPTLIDAKEGGLPESPQSTIPQNPSIRQPSKPQIDQEHGALIGGADAVPNAVQFMQRQFKELQQMVKESRGTDEETRKLKELGQAVDHLRGQIEQIKLLEPHRSDELSRWDGQLSQLKRDMTSLRYDMFKRKYL